MSAQLLGAICTSWMGRVDRSPGPPTACSGCGCRSDRGATTHPHPNPPSKYNAHTEPLFKKLKVLKVNDILQLQELKFYYKFVRVKLPVYLQNLPFYPNRSYHDFNTRTFDDIHINRIKHEFAKRCIRYDIPLIVNNTSNLIKNKIVTHSLHGFSCYVKKHLLQNYQNLCSVPNCYICQQSH